MQLQTMKDAFCLLPSFMFPFLISALIMMISIFEFNYLCTVLKADRIAAKVHQPDEITNIFNEIKSYF